MALMTKIRDNLSKLFAAFAVVFILYIMLDWGMDLTTLNPGGNVDLVGSIGGRDIKYREFAELLRRMTENYKQQTGKDPDDETERQLRDQVWNEFVTQTLVQKEIERLNIHVTDDEIIDVVHGPNPPEFLVNQFRDSLGVFNRAAYDRALGDPDNSAAWLQVEEIIRRQRMNDKLMSLLFASVRVTEGEIKQRYVDRNITLDAEYALFDPARMIPDSLVTVTDEEIRKHHEQNQHEFRVRPSRRVKYVSFSHAPSREDTADVMNEMTRFVEQVNAGVDFLEMAKTYSEIPVTDAFFKHGELSRVKENAVFAAKKGEVVGPLVDFDGIHLIKVLDDRKGTAEFVKASHILLSNVVGPDSVEKIQKAGDLLRQIRAGADFAALANEHSEDPGSAINGGELGWTGRGGWVKPFEDAAFRARVGDVVGPVRSQFGWHIIKVTGRDNREVKIASLALRIKASAHTIDQTFQMAEDFSVLAQSEGFEKAAEFSNYEVRETPEFSKGAVIPGIGVNESVSRFAFSNKVGKISDPIKISNGVAVFMVSAVKDEGFRSLEEVKGIVRSQVVRKKKMEQLKPRIDEFHKAVTAGADFLPTVQSYQNISAQRTGSFKPNEPGRDPVFVGVALALKPGDISKPFDGSRGYYVMKLISRSEFDSTRYAAEWQTLRDQIMNEKRNRFTSDWLAQLREKADIEDNRDRFYR